MSVEFVEKLDEMKLIGIPYLTPSPLVGDVEEGIVYREDLREHAIYACTVPLKDGSKLLLKGTDAIIVSLFGELENGGVVLKDTITTITTLRKKDVARVVRRVEKRLGIAGMTIHETEDRTGYYMQPAESIGP